jgi:hypothetical protein
LATATAADEPTLRSLRDRLGLQVDDLDQETVGENDVATGTKAIENLQRRLFKDGGPLEAKADHTVEVFSAPVWTNTFAKAYRPGRKTVREARGKRITNARPSILRFSNYG